MLEFGEREEEGRKTLRAHNMMDFGDHYSLTGRSLVAALVRWGLHCCCEGSN
jgi:hypothetical protein